MVVYGIYSMTKIEESKTMTTKRQKQIDVLAIGVLDASKSIDAAVHSAHALSKATCLTKRMRDLYGAVEKQILDTQRKTK